MSAAAAAAASGVAEKSEEAPPTKTLVNTIQLRIGTRTVRDGWFTPLKFTFSDNVDAEISTDKSEFVHPRDTLQAPPEAVHMTPGAWEWSGIYAEHPLMFMLVEADPPVLGMRLDDILPCLDIVEAQAERDFVKKFVMCVQSVRSATFAWLPKLNADSVLPPIDYNSSTPSGARRVERIIPVSLLPFLHIFIGASRADGYDMQMSAVDIQLYRMVEHAEGNTDHAERTRAQFVANRIAAKNNALRTLESLHNRLEEKVLSFNARLVALERNLPTAPQVIPTATTAANNPDLTPFERAFNARTRIEKRSAGRNSVKGRNRKTKKRRAGSE